MIKGAPVALRNRCPQGLLPGEGSTPLWASVRQRQEAGAFEGGLPEARPCQVGKRLEIWGLRDGEDGIWGGEKPQAHVTDVIYRPFPFGLKADDTEQVNVINKTGHSINHTIRLGM